MSASIFTSADNNENNNKNEILLSFLPPQSLANTPGYQQAPYEGVLLEYPYIQVKHSSFDSMDKNDIHKLAGSIPQPHPRPLLVFRQEE